MQHAIGDDMGVDTGGRIGRGIEAVVLDVGGVFLIPDPESVATALSPLGIEIDRALIERAHYTGVGALDACHIGLRSPVRVGDCWSTMAPSPSGPSRSRRLARPRRRTGPAQPPR